MQAEQQHVPENRDKRSHIFLQLVFTVGKNKTGLHCSVQNLLLRGMLATERQIRVFNIFLISPFKHFYLLTSFGVGVVGPGGSFMLGKHWASETYPQSNVRTAHKLFIICIWTA